MNKVAWLAVLSAPLLLGQSAPKPAESPADPLASIAWMAGGTWHGEAQAPGGGGTMRIDTRYRKLLDGRAIAFDTSFNGVQQYAGSFGYDAVRKQIVFTYAAADGGWIEGTVQPQPEYLLYDFEVHESSGTAGHYQVRVHKDGADDYTWALFAQQEAKWAPLFQVKYHRLAE